MLGVALGAISSPEDTKVLSLLAIAQRLEARWPDSEGQRIDSQKSWSAKPLNGKQTCADIMSTNHHHSHYLLAGSKDPLNIIFYRLSARKWSSFESRFWPPVPTTSRAFSWRTPANTRSSSLRWDFPLSGNLIQLEQNSSSRYRISKTISPFQDIRFNQIRALLDYMYHGEVCQMSIHYGINISHLNNSLLGIEQKAQNIDDMNLR